MKKYTTIPNSAACKLNSADTYRFTCLSFTPKKDGFTDSTFKQIGEYVNKSKPEVEPTIKDFVNRLKMSNLIRIDEVYIDGKNRNKYFFPELKLNFKMIKSELLEADFSADWKGFLIQLFTITYNGTLEVNLSMNKICTHIKISIPTARKYLKELENLQLVTKTEKGLLLTDKYFIIGKSPKQKLIEQIKERNKDSIFSKRFLYRTNWSTIKDPIKFELSVVAGYVNKQSENKAETPIITL